MASEKSLELNEQLVSLYNRQADLVSKILTFRERYNVDHIEFILDTDPYSISDRLSDVSLSDDDKAMVAEFRNNHDAISNLRLRVTYYKAAADVRGGQLLSAGGVISQADPQNIQEVFAGQLRAIDEYHATALRQSDRSFQWALRASIVGLIFFIAAIILLLIQQPSEIAIVSVIGGAITEFIAAINFYLYGKTSEQLSEFRAGLERTGRYLLANSVALNITSENQAQAEAMKDLVRLAAGGDVPDANPHNID